MVLDLFEKGVLIGSVVKGGPGIVYAYDPDGAAVGTFGDLDAAAAALSRRKLAA